jgi:hypothetical protein
MAVGEQVRTVAAAPVAQFSQTAFVFGVVGFVFLLFVIMRGQLPKWVGLFTGKGSAATSPTTGALTMPGTGQIASPAYATPGSNAAGAATPDAAQPGTYGDNVVSFTPLPKLGTVP